MPVFEKERPETLKRYSSPKGTLVQRTETPIRHDQLAPSLREVLGNLGNLMAVEVSGGEWHHLPVDKLDPDSEGMYTTTETDEAGLTNSVHYSISPKGRVAILSFSFNWNRITSEILDSHRNKKNFDTIPTAWLNTKPDNDLPVSIRYGLDATVTIEPVPGTNLTAPVLRYTEHEIRLPVYNPWRKEIIPIIPKFKGPFNS